MKCAYSVFLLKQKTAYEMRISDGSSDVCSSDLAEAFAAARRFLSYLPSSIHERAARTACSDPVGRREEALLSTVPREAKQVYSMRRVADAVFDRGSVFEMGARWGRRSEEHTSELQSLMRTSYAVFCLNKK